MPVVSRQCWVRTVGSLLAITVAVTQTGCVHRRMTVRSNPPGAAVFVDNYEIGTTPVSTDFIYYGTREIRLVKEGYETLTVKQSFPTPWYEYFPLDFVSENVVPTKIHDERLFSYNMIPQQQVPTQVLVSRAENLRQGTRAQIPTIGVPAPGQPMAAAPSYVLPGNPYSVPAAQPGMEVVQPAPGSNFQAMPGMGAPVQTAPPVRQLPPPQYQTPQYVPIP